MGKVEGNFFTGLILEDVLLTDNTDTTVYVAKVEALYNLWPLLNSKLEISSATINKPTIFTKQLNDSTWNLQQIVKISDTTKDSTATDSTSFEIDLSKSMIVERNIKIESPDSIIPKQIIDLNTELSLQYSSKSQKITINQFNLRTVTPDLILQQLSFQLTRNLQNIELKDFYQKTAQNKIEGKAGYKPELRLEANVNLNS